MDIALLKYALIYKMTGLSLILFLLISGGVLNLNFHMFTAPVDSPPINLIKSNFRSCIFLQVYKKYS